MIRFVAILICVLALHVRAEEFITTSEEVDLFADQPCELTWDIHALPGSEVVIRGQVLQASSSLAVPLKELNFELKAQVEAGKIAAQTRHTLSLPKAARVAVFIVKWQSGAAVGNVIVRLFPERVLPAYPPVMIDDHEALQPLRAAFEAEKIVPGTDWKGIRFTKAKSSAEIEPLKSQALAAGQCHVVFADLPGLRGTTLVKPAGAGRLIIMPSAFLNRFPTSPLVQQSILDLSKP